MNISEQFVLDSAVEPCGKDFQGYNYFMVAVSVPDLGHRKFGCEVYRVKNSTKRLVWFSGWGRRDDYGWDRGEQVLSFFDGLKG